MGFVEFPRLILVGHCLREAGAGDSNPLTPTISSLLSAVLACLHATDALPLLPFGANLAHGGIMATI